MTNAAVIAAAAASRGQGEVVRRLRDAGALSADTATAIGSLSRLGRRALARLIRGGLVHKTAPGICWLDEAAFALRQKSAHRFLAVVAGIGLIVLAAGILFAFTRS